MKRTEHWALVIERMSPLRELRTLWVQSRMLLAKLTESTKSLRTQILQFITTCTADRADRITELADYVSTCPYSHLLPHPHYIHSIIHTVISLVCVEHLTFALNMCVLNNLAPHLPMPPQAAGLVKVPKLELQSFANFLYNLAAVHSQQYQIKFALHDVEILYNQMERCSTALPAYSSCFVDKTLVKI